jgi:hypothetical protein
MMATDVTVLLVGAVLSITARSHDSNACFRLLSGHD